MAGEHMPSLVMRTTLSARNAYTIGGGDGDGGVGVGVGMGMGEVPGVPSYGTLKSVLCPFPLGNCKSCPVECNK